MKTYEKHIIMMSETTQSLSRISVWPKDDNWGGEDFIVEKVDILMPNIIWSHNPKNIKIHPKRKALYLLTVIWYVS